jgi:signal transduction histidine kinase
VLRVGRIVAPYFPALLDDFCAVLQEHPVAFQVITGGEAQSTNLKQSLSGWLNELFAGVYDENYVEHRLHVGQRHVAIALDQVYTNVALSRLRGGLIDVLREHWTDTPTELLDAIGSLNKLLDLDLAIIDDAYESEHVRREKVAERLAGIGQMITGLAHESRNALQRIQACAEMLELAVEGNTEALDLVHRIKLAQDHMRRLFDEVRGYAAPVNLDRSACQLGSVWREAWELLLPQWEGRIAEIIDRTVGTDLRLYGDHFRLVQLFRILFENSLAACPDPVRIEIACHGVILGNVNGVRVSVRDNGPGLSQQQREHMFEPFYTTKTKGTGLGLAIAQRIVEAHGGQITVGQEIAHGAEIVVDLPYSAPE